MAAPNPYLSVLEQEAERIRVAQGASLLGGPLPSPEAYAEQRRQAAALQVPVAVVEATPEQSKLEAQAALIQRATARSAALQRRYTDEDFKKLASDDSGALGKLGDAVAWAARTAMGAGENNRSADSTSVADVARYAMGADSRGARQAGAPQALLAGVHDANRGAAGIFAALLEATGLGGAAADFRYAGAASKASADKLVPPTDSIVKSGVNSGLRSTTSNVLMLPAALLPGGQPAALAGFGGVAGGGAYLDAREQGMAVPGALVFGTSQGLIEYATEKIPLKRLIGDLSAAAPLYKTVANQIAKEAPGEQLATVLQDLNEWAALPANANKPFSDYIAERPSAAAQTFIATVVGVGGNIAVGTVMQTAVDRLVDRQYQVEQANDDAERLAEVFKLAAQSKLRQRDHKLLAGLVQELAEESGEAPTALYVDARTLVGEGGLLNQEQLAELLPSILPQVEEALLTGGDLVLPIGELVGNVSGTPLEQKLLEHLRTTPDGLSPFEAKQASEQAAAYMQGEAAKVLDETVDRTALEASAEKVKAFVQEQLAAANRFTPDVHDAYSTLVRDFYTVMASRLGTTPEQMYAAYPLRVAAVNPAEGNLQQPAFHGTHARGIERFSLDKIGTGEGAQVYGHGLYFAGNKDIAEFYRKSVTEKQAADDIDYFNASMNLTMALQDKVSLVGQGREMTDADLLAFAKEHMPDRPETRAFEREFAKVGQGQLYRVEVPNDDQLLDYHARLADQPEGVRRALEQIGFASTQHFVREKDGGKVFGPYPDLRAAQRFITANNMNADAKAAPSTQTGQSIYQALSRRLGGDRAASEALRTAGVPGLRYLDAGSRGAQARSRHYNYVIFDDSAVTKTGEFYQSGRKAGDTRYQDRARELAAREKAPRRSAVGYFTGDLKVPVLPTNEDISEFFTMRNARGMEDWPSRAAVKRMVAALRADTLHALQDAGSAVGWYDRRVNAALDLMAQLHPEIATDAQSKFGFIAMLAITSNSTNVNENFEQAEGLYRQWKETGEWPAGETLTDKAGKQKQNGLAKLRSLVQAHGWEKVRDFMVGDQSITDIEAFSGETIQSELADEKVYGAVFLGSKVGAFFNNLYGNFNPVTMDRWFMRAINRTRGAMLALPTTFDKHLAALRNDLASAAEFGADAATIEAEVAAFLALPDAQRSDVLLAREKLPHVLAYARSRHNAFARSGFAPRTAENVRAKTLYESMTLDQQSPAGGGDRRLLRSVMRELQADLQEDGIPIEMADLQAVLWYYEKDLFALLKGKNRQADLFGEAGEVEDYETAARRVVEQRAGRGDAVRGARPGAAGRGRPAGRAPAQQPAPATGDLFQGGGDQPLAGLPRRIAVDGVERAFGPHAPARAAAEAYMASAGLPYAPPTTYVKVDPQRGARIARAFDRMIHDPKDPKVKASYGAMIAETLAQYEAILATGLKVEFNSGVDPYGNPRNAILDVIENNHLFVFSTRDGFGSDATFDPKDNPLLGETKYTDANGVPMLANDVFRVVHDYFGHIKEGVGFRADGEENAWRSHAAMYSDLARPAMTTETRGQNSWVNFGPHAVANATANGGDTIYADQKIGLLPGWVVTEGATDERPGDAAPAADGGRGGNVVRGEGGRVALRGVHYSAQRRSHLDGTFYGRGIRGAERARVEAATDPRLKSRVYFYVDEGAGIRPEAGVGAIPHDVSVDNFYDGGANPLKLPTGDQNAFESAVLDAGFDGYYVPKVFNNQGVAVALGDASRNVPVRQRAPLAQGPRGSFNPGSLSITLLEQADLSTFLHETGHFFLEVMADVASQPGAPEQVRADMQQTLQWFGVKDIETWNAMSLDQKRPHHEKFAESFEQYLFEGKAPGHELQALFGRFRAWLVNVYRSLTDFLASHDGATLTPEVRGVFDRMLAAEEAIKGAEAARAYAPDEKATERAIENLQKRSLRDMRWTANARSKTLRALQKDVAEKRKAVEAEVEAELAATPVEQARVYVAELEKAAAAASKEHKKARDDWNTRYGAAKQRVAEDVKGDEAFNSKEARKLELQRRMFQWEAEHPAPRPEIAAADMDIAAERFGFSSGDELARAIETAPPLAEHVEALTDQRLLERYGDLTTSQGIERAADEAIHNEARGRFMATSLKALQEAGSETEATGKTIKSKTKAGKPVERAQTVNVIVRAAKEFAEKLVARRKVRDLKPGQHRAAETRAGKAMLAAMAAGNTEEAIVAQRDQLLNHYAARYADDARAEVDKAVRKLRALADGTTLPPEYQEQIDTLLDRFDLRDAPLRAIDKRKSLQQWIESQRAIGVEPELAPELLDEARRKSYKDMSVEEFRGLVDAVKQIEHLGRLKDKLLTAHDQRTFEATRDALAQSVRDNAGDREADTRTPTTNWGRALQAMRSFGAAHIKAATLARILDGGQDGGPMWETFVRAANERGAFETKERAAATTALAGILGLWLKAGKNGGSGRYFPTVKRSFNRESILAIALNTGNEGNLQRLLGGEGWTLDQLEPILNTLTRSDWETVQHVWDYLDSFRPQIAEKQKRVYGVEPEWVQPAPRTVTLPDGTTLDLKGGYYPIKYDPAASVRAEEHADAEGAKRQLQGAYGAATTRRSFTKARAEEVTGRPLLYTLAGVYSGVNDVIHDLAWHEWLIDTNRLLKSQAIDGAIREHYGPEVVRQFKTWRDDIAEGDGQAQAAIDRALGALRQGVSAAGLGYNLMSALIQPLGLTQSIVRVGPQWIGKGLVQYIGNPVRATADVQAQSEFMASRARTFNRELNEVRNRVQGASTLMEKQRQYAYFMMQQLQQAVDVPTWLGAYEKAVADGNDELRSRALADQAVIDAQGSGRTQDMSAIERGGPAQKLFTTFYSFMNTGLNLGVASKMTPGSRAKFAAEMAMLFVVPAVLGSLLKNALTPGDSGDDEDARKLARKLLGEQLAYLMGLMVVTREFAEAGKAVTGATDHPRDYAGPAGVRVIADATQAAKQAQQGEFDDSFRKAIVNLAGSVWGLPAAQINRSITGFKALKDGKTKNPAALFLGYQEPR